MECEVVAADDVDIEVLAIKWCYSLHGWIGDEVEPQTLNILYNQIIFCESR